jgi:hypothetical protein
MLVIRLSRDDEVHEHALRSVIGDLPPPSLSRIRLKPPAKARSDCWPRLPAASPAGLQPATGGNPFS